eukprot:comp23624_c1_seq1/m.40251 comp23624_c1_seq1/g.40251  ORF comp23624_c1_seq1/g.40251 comp23624_c1_seq1/m.40251 type:complete len:102 (+) comp23624_c1_seq1:95-400(+)
MQMDIIAASLLLSILSISGKHIMYPPGTQGETTTTPKPSPPQTPNYRVFTEILVKKKEKAKCASTHHLIDKRGRKYKGLRLTFKTTSRVLMHTETAKLRYN